MTKITDEQVQAFIDGCKKRQPDCESYDGLPCTCKDDCPVPCKGVCGCKACHTAYQDFLSNE